MSKLNHTFVQLVSSVARREPLYDTVSLTPRDTSPEGLAREMGLDPTALPKAQLEAMKTADQLGEKPWEPSVLFARTYMPSGPFSVQATQVQLFTNFAALPKAPQPAPKISLLGKGRTV